MTPVFKFKKFDVRQEKSAMKVNTDSVLLGSWVEVSDSQKILDIGTGTGLIALMMAQRNETAIIHAVEIDKDAYKEARDNFAQADWCDRLEAFHAPIQTFENGLAPYDFIICNPPFFTGGTLSENQNRSSVRHTVKLPNNELLRSARRLLSKDGRFAVVLPYLEGLRFIEMAKIYGFCLRRQANIYPRADKGINRLLIEFGLHECESVDLTDIIIYQSEASREYTEAYKKLTRAFYLKH
ncbi:MAG TPA: methyltransferase domain-containing protein [Saprospiraceae bacterium]|nr:methyltransferase domain-containing protein [Saprospiraceae bacterium]